MTTTPEQIAAGLTKVQRAVIVEMSDGEWVYPVAQIAANANVPVKEAKQIIASFRASGLAVHTPLWNDEEHRTAGSGTWLTRKGLTVRNIILDQPNDQ